MNPFLTYTMCLRLSLCIILAVVALGAVKQVSAQEGSSIPDEYRGNTQSVARGILDGNLIETNYRNHGEFARWNDHPWGIWPRGSGARHIDGIGVVVAGLVRGERAKWAGEPYNFWPAGTPDTLINPISVNIRGSGFGTDVGPRGDVWGWLPLPGFHNPNRRNPLTGGREPVPAISGDPSSWPQFWPDRLDEEDSGWPGAWNGMFGKGVFNADAESYYVMDDLSDRTHQRDPITGRNYSNFGMFYPDPADSTKGGLGLQVGVRILQWANILAEDTMFLIYRITNKGTTNFGECIDIGTGTRPPNAVEGPECPGNTLKTGLYFTQLVDFGMGFEEDDETAAFDPVLDVAYGWDHDMIGTRETGGSYRLGYSGFAFLESPTNEEDGLDNDQDGMLDEERFGGPGSRIVGQANIRAEAEARYDLNLFEAKFGRLENRPAYMAGIWWTGDEDMDWVGFDDANGNGRYDEGELLNDDYGRDGLGPFDPGYPGPDAGEGDGRPSIGEPNFDELDVDESDQIGLTGFHLASRKYYQPGAVSNIPEDTWLWARIRENQFPVGTEPEEQTLPDQEPFLNFSSGPVSLPGNSTDFFSTAWIFGSDEVDFFRNRKTAQDIYDADYRFAQPPIVPTLKAEPGDGYVVLSWDTLSLASYDRFTQEFDFEGYKLYKGTDELLSDARLVTDVDGAPQFYRPLARWDLVNGITGNVPVLQNTALYNLGSDTGLEFSYIDRDVTNGKTYYYALVAYDRGFVPEADGEETSAADAIDPQENTFNVRTLTRNVAVVTPRARAAGYVDASTNEDLSQPTEGIGTGSIEVTVVNSAELQEDAVYRLTFSDSTAAGADVYTTTHYELRNVTTNEVLIPRSPIVGRTPAADGFVINIDNDPAGLDPARTGWRGTDDDGDVMYSRNPAELDDVNTNWGVSLVRPDTSARYRATLADYELRWADSLYTSPSAAETGYLRSQQLPFWCTNLQTGAQCDIIVFDQNGNGTLDLTGDRFVVADRTGLLYRYRYQVEFSIFGGESNPPETGDAVRISATRPFSRNDYFQFTMRGGRVDVDLARSELDRISVVPNPYIAAAEWEPGSEVSGRGPRQIQFIRLPEQCTIKIYTMRGELVRTLLHDGVAGDGAAWWDLKTEDNQEVAYGMYFYHVSSPDIGEKTGKFAIVK